MEANYLNTSGEFLRFFAKFLLNDFKGMMNQAKITEGQYRDVVTPFQLGMIVVAIFVGVITRIEGRKIIKDRINGFLELPNRT